MHPAKDEEARFELFEESRPREKASVKRVGVPGGRAVQHHSELKELFRWSGSSFQAAATSRALLLHLLVWLTMFEGLRFANVGAPLEKELTIHPTVTAGMTFITTFSISSYMGAVLGRFHERFNNCCQTNGNMTLISCICGAQLAGEKRRCATMMRYALLMMHLYYFAIFGPMSEANWRTLRARNLLTAPEETHLRSAKKKGAVVYVWGVRIIHQLHIDGKLADVQARRLEEQFGGLRGLAAKQIAYQTTPVPFPYFHLMMLMVQAFLHLMEWNSAVRLHDRLLADATPLETFEEHFGFLLEVMGTGSLIVLFNTVKHIGQWMADPYGADATDYDLDFDLLGLWEEAVESLSNMSDAPAPAGAADVVRRGAKPDKGAPQPTDDVATKMIKLTERDEPFLVARLGEGGAPPAGWGVGGGIHAQ